MSMTSGEGIGQPMTAGKIRVYELAKELGLPNKDLVTKIRALGIDAKNHMSNLEVDDVLRIRRALDKERQENLVEERITATVIRRRTKDGTAVRTPIHHAPPTPLPRRGVSVEPVVRAERGVRPAEGGPPPSPVAAFHVPSERPAPPVFVSEAARDAESAARPLVMDEPIEPTRPPASSRAAAGAVEATAASERTEPSRLAEPQPPTTPYADADGHAAPARPGIEAPVEEEHKAASAPVSTLAEQPPVSRESPPEPPPTRPEPLIERAPIVSSSRIVDVSIRPGTLRPPAPTPSHTIEPSRQGSMQTEARPAPQAHTQPQQAPVKPEPVKTGPTGRVIELPHMRQPIIQVTERGAPQPPRPGLRITRQEPEERAAGGRFARQQQNKKKQPFGKKAKQTQITTPAAHKRVIKMEESIGVSELARQMGIKATDVLKKLWGMGMTGITLNSGIDPDAATLVAQEFGYEVENVAFQESDVFAEPEARPEDLMPRAPVVTIMGHVDHGKTSLLDAIRNANVAAGEAGGITQHIGAYRVSASSGDVVFLDTPGHEAFTSMRARGAQVTDIVVLVVAADDGVMPTTVEALNHAKAAEVAIIVAVNKIDKPNAQPDRIRQQLSDHGLVPEQWGGETIYVDVSARTKQGVEQLLEMLALQAEVLELKANPKKLARGTVVEGKLDRNRGPVATVLVQDGTLRVGDTIVAGEQMGKVRAMLDDKGRTLASAGPSTPIEVLGLSGVPGAGDTFNAVADEKAAKELVEHRRDLRRKKDLGGTGKVSLENILEKIREGTVKELKVVLKTDVQGSAEALRDALINLSTEQVKVDVISSGVGGITETDVNLAKAGSAVIVGFHVRPAGKAAQLAEQEGVDIKLYDVIYEALDDIKKAMAGLLAPVKREKALGKAEVRQTFSIPKIGVIAGCSVSEGLIRRSSQVRLVRDSVQIYQGRISSLRRFKDDVREVVQGYECGIGIENFNDIKVGDVIEAYEIEEIAPTL